MDMFGILGDYGNSDPGRVVTNTPQGYHVQSLGSWLGEQAQPGQAQQSAGYTPSYGYTNLPYVPTAPGRSVPMILAIVAFVFAVVALNLALYIHDAPARAEQKWEACYAAHPATPTDAIVSVCGPRP